MDRNEEYDELINELYPTGPAEDQIDTNECFMPAEKIEKEENIPTVLTPVAFINQKDIPKSLTKSNFFN